MKHRNFDLNLAEAPRELCAEIFMPIPYLQFAAQRILPIQEYTCAHINKPMPTARDRMTGMSELHLVPVSHGSSQGTLTVPPDCVQEAPEQVLDLVAAGFTLEEIGKQEGLPDEALIRKWIREDPAFRRELFEAHQVNTFAKQIATSALVDNVTEDDLPVVRFKAEMRLKEAKAILPEYGVRKQVRHDIGGGLQGLVDQAMENGRPEPVQIIPPAED